MKVLAGILGGLLIALIGAVVVAVANAGGSGAGGGRAAIAFLVLWIGGVVVAVRSPSAPKAWRRLLIIAAVSCMMLPLAAILFTGGQVAGALQSGGQHAGAAAVGSAIGGGLVSGLMGLVGFFLGAIFLVIGLLVGRATRVMYVQAPSDVSKSA